MSMLAEKRRKQKWSLNPQGKHWLSDSNKFGLKILENMGWKEGKGLGKQQDGITEPIRVAFKNDNKGLGLKENPSSMQQDHFNALLESLNKDDSKTPKTITSLEEKSQNSRTRVHYKKFTRGKDLSKYSAKDLANIFEKKSLSPSTVTIPVNNTEPDNTINKGSMTDYFNNKMPNGLKLVRRRSNSDSDNEQSFGFGFAELGVTNPAFDPLKPTFTLTTKHSLDTITEMEEEILNESNPKKTEVKKRKKNKSCSLDEVKCNRTDSKVMKRKKGIDNPALNDSIVHDNKGDKVKKQKKGLDNPALQLSDSSPEQKPKKRKKIKCGIDNPGLNLDLNEVACDFITNVVEEPVLVTKIKVSKKKGLDNYGFDVKAQRIEENIGCISRSIETYQAEVENDINEIKDEDMYVGDFSGCDGENLKQKDGVLLRFKYASFTKDPHWTVRHNQMANLAKKSYKHLIKGDIAVGFKESNLHEIKGYGLRNKM